MRILLADDHALFRDSLRSLLTARGHEVVGEAADGEEAVALAREIRPDLVLMDLRMRGMDGLAATRVLTSEQPEIQIVILTASDDDRDLFAAVKAGARGYLLKDLEADHFFTLLDELARGGAALTPRLARRVLDELARPRPEEPGSPPRQETAHHPDALTDREREVLELMVEGVTSNRGLARALGLSENTVKYHVKNILDKLHLHDRAQAVGHALRSGMVDVGEPDEGGGGGGR